MPIITDGLLGHLEFNDPMLKNERTDRLFENASKALAIAAGLITINEAMRMSGVRSDAAAKIIDGLTILWVARHAKSLQPALAMAAMTYVLNTLPPSNKLRILKIAFAAGQSLLAGENHPHHNALTTITAATIASWAVGAQIYAEYLLFLPKPATPHPTANRAGRAYRS